MVGFISVDAVVHYYAHNAVQQSSVSDPRLPTLFGQLDQLPQSLGQFHNYR